MRINLVSIEDGLDNVGFRKLSAYIKQLYPATRIHYVTTGNLRSLTKVITMGGFTPLQQDDIADIAAQIADARVVAFSSMTPFAKITAEIIAQVRCLNPEVLIVWGGIHAIMYPTDAILHADAVCTGEGEFAFRRFLAACDAGSPLSPTPGFWIRTAAGIVKSNNLPLMSGPEMDQLPFPSYQEGELIYKRGNGFVPLEPMDFVNWCGLAYNTVWSIGCPMTCIYCGNSTFLQYDVAYGKIRHSSPLTIVAEIREAIRKHPHISTVVFHDDSFMALPLPVLEEFATHYASQVGLPFAVMGLGPNQVTEEKMALLISAGMNRVRMGIQSGSQRILDFYGRQTSIERVRESCRIINIFNQRMIPPAYDLILDNPVEAVEDVVATLDLLYGLPKPYTLNLFSLRVIPNTGLAAVFAERGLPVPDITTGYFKHQPTLGNILIYAIMLFNLPASLFQRLRSEVLPSCHEQRHYPVLMFVLRLFYLVRRAFGHLLFMDFTVLTGRTGYLLWRIGFIKLWQRYFLHSRVAGR